MCVAWSLHLPAIGNQALIESIDVLAGLLDETNMQDVELPGVIKAFELVIEMIDDQNQPIIILHDGHFDPTDNESAQAEILFEHYAISLSIVAVEIDMVQLHDCVFPLVRRTRAGRKMDNDDRPRARPILVVSGHGQERVYSLKRDCLSRETTGCHHTCIAVFLGKNDFADTSSSGQATSSVMSAYETPTGQQK